MRPKRCPMRSAAFATALLALSALMATARISRADEGGVPFWLSGQFGSLAAVPQVPGWAIGITDYYASVSASGNAAAARLAIINKLPINVNINLNVNLSGKSDLVFVSPSYTFATPVFGGQLGASLGIGAGPSTADLSGALQEDRLRAVAEIGPDVESAIRDALPNVRARVPRVPLGRAVELADPFITALRSISTVNWAEPSGSLRRGEDTVGDIELVVRALRKEKIAKVGLEIEPEAERLPILRLWHRLLGLVRAA